jgi:hypothetical protein
MERDWGERHRRQSREGSGRAQPELPRYKTSRRFEAVLTRVGFGWAKKKQWIAAQLFLVSDLQGNLDKITLLCIDLYVGRSVLYLVGQ